MIYHIAIFFSRKSDSRSSSSLDRKKTFLTKRDIRFHQLEARKRRYYAEAKGGSVKAINCRRILFFANVIFTGRKNPFLTFMTLNFKEEEKTLKGLEFIKATSASKFLLLCRQKSVLSDARVAEDILQFIRM